MSRVGDLFIVAAAILLVILLLTTSLGPLAVEGGEKLASELGIPTELGQSSGPPLNYTVYSPLIENGSAKISFPEDYTALSQYALGQINADRENFSLGPVGFSTSEVAQQHADSMLRYGYFSHFDTQGYKPYMRYSLLGGIGAIEENIATERFTGTEFTGTASVEGAIRSLEHAMVYDDATCCNNGHRDNILTALHNRVSIGVAYNATTVYFVEDFETILSNATFAVSSSYTFAFSGTPLPSGVVPESVLIAYDPPPTPETPAQLNAGPHFYTPGTVLGGVLPPCNSLFGGCEKFDNGTTVYATEWTFSSTRSALTFSLRDFIQEKGAGVYTVYILTGSDTTSAITSISVFIS